MIASMMYYNGYGSTYKIQRNADGTYKAELRFNGKLIKKIGTNWDSFDYDGIKAAVEVDASTEYEETAGDFSWW